MADVIQTTYDTKINREDLADIISMISPQDTPLYSLAKATTATGTKHEWITDELDAPASNAAIEGADTDAEAASGTSRLVNYTQIFTKAGSVSGTQREVSTAGTSDEMARQIMKRGAELKKDMELAFLSNQKATVGTKTTARQLRGLSGWIPTANADGGVGFAAGTDSAAMTEGTARAFTEDQLKKVIQACYEAGGNPTKILLAPGKKVALTKSAALGSTVRTQRHADDKIAGAVVDVYQSDFGQLDVIPNRVMKNSVAANDLTDRIFVVDPEQIAVATLRKVEKIDLAKTGDADKFQLVAEATLEVINPNAHGGVFDLS